jgi:hypothetical protein
MPLICTGAETCYVARIAVGTVFGDEPEGNDMTVRRIQTFLSTVFFALGGWCLVSPSSVLALTIRPDYQSAAPIVPFVVGCFGAQAMIAGLFAAFSRFTGATFVAYGVSLLAFLVFDYWFYFVVPLFTPLGMLDAIGNVAMLALCLLGWRAAKSEAVSAT